MPNVLCRIIRHSSFVITALGIGLAIALFPRPQLITAVALIVAVVVVAAIFHQPVFGIALAMLAGPFQPLERVSLQLPLDSGQIILGITLLSYFARALVTRRSPLFTLHSPPTSALVIFIAVCLLSYFPARDFADWANECIKWLQLLAIALLVLNERDPRKRAIVIGAILLSAAGQAIFGIIQADVRGFGPREFQVLGSKTNFRAYGTFEQPNPFGGYMGLAWPLAASVCIWAFSKLWTRRSGETEKRRLDRYSLSPRPLVFLTIASLLTSTLCLLALVASGSRGALIGAATAIVVMGLALLKHPLRWVGVLVLMGLLAIGLDVINVPLSLDGQLQQILDIDVRNAHILPTTFSTIERLAHWQAAVRMIEASPWLGVGFGNYAAAYSRVQAFYLGQRTRPRTQLLPEYFCRGWHHRLHRVSRILGNCLCSHYSLDPPFLFFNSQFSIFNWLVGSLRSPHRSSRFRQPLRRQHAHAHRCVPWANLCNRAIILE